MTLNNGKIMNGNKMCVMAINVPVELWIIDNLLSSAIKLIPTKKSLITPSFWSKAIHALVRTNNEVQKGNNTRIINKLLVLVLSVARRYAIG